MITQAEAIRPYGAPLAGDYPKYTAGTAMLETAERLTPVEKEPAMRQFLLLIGGLRALGETGEDAKEPRLVLDAYLLRSLAVAGYAPALEECARCGAPGTPATRMRPVGHRPHRAPRRRALRLRGRGGRHGLRVLPAAGRRVAERRRPSR